MLELTRQTADAEDELARVQPVSSVDQLLATWPQRLLAGVNGAADALWLVPPQPASSKTAAKAKPGSAAHTGLVRAGMG
jgi:hypothetical protein